jgi:hypothetical protein
MVAPGETVAKAAYLARVAVKVEDSVGSAVAEVVDRVRVSRVVGPGVLGAMVALEGAA